MALRREDLAYRSPGRVLDFPIERAVARLRRRRLLEARRRLAALVAGLVVIVALVLGGGTGGTGVASKPGAPRAVVLQPGETLWDVATEFAPSGVDPRAYVDALEELNDLRGTAPAGMQLTLPR
ncbi:MAG: hypothetical protein ACRDK3_08500 [Actinomycetota bacterium]